MSKAQPGLLKKTLFYAIPLLVFLGLLEGLLRVVEREQVMVRGGDSDLIYGLYPEREAIAAGPEYRVHIQTDAKGRRICKNDSQSEDRQSPAVRKILILGDSFSEGWGVECEQSFVGRLQKEIGTDTRIINAGIHGGTMSYFILRARREMQQQKPDVLVVQIFDNDLDDLDKVAPYIELDEKGNVHEAAPPWLLILPPDGPARFVRELALYRVTRRLVNTIRGRPDPIKYFKVNRAPEEPVLNHAQAIQEFGGLAPLSDAEKDYNGQFAFYKYKKLNQIQSNPVWSSRFERMHHYITQLVRESRAINSEMRIVLVYIPANEVFAAGGILGQPGQQLLSVAQLHAENPFYQLLAELQKELDIEILDGQSVFKQDAESLYFPGDAHLNATGHARLAEALRKIL